MKKRAFPKGLKFGTYLPQRQGMSYIKLSDLASAFERFMGEYFSQSTLLFSAVDFSASDAVLIDGEYTAYLFRNVMSALSGSDNVYISLSCGKESVTVAFIKKGGVFDLNDTELAEKLLDSARLSGFSVSLAGNTLSFTAKLERGKLVISALTKDKFIEILERVFFG